LGLYLTAIPVDFEERFAHLAASSLAPMRSLARPPTATKVRPANAWASCLCCEAASQNARPSGSCSILAEKAKRGYCYAQ